MRRFHYTQGVEKVKNVVLERVQFFGPKLSWFLSKGYEPHVYQLAFHTMCQGSLLVRFRMLVAGRRGGKTLSAAWEVAYYSLHPEAYHWDAHGKTSDEPLHVWVLSPDHKNTGRAARRTFLKVLNQAGLHEGHDFKYNKGELTIEFENGSLIEFKTADRADNLVGARIHILWIDEAALIPNKEAYDYVSPALDDNIGIVLGTTTPRGKNWFFETFWGEDAQEDENIGTVEYRTLDNPHFPREVWEYRRRTFHPLKFKQEYMAAFDSMAGKALPGEWLHYYEIDDLPLKNESLGHWAQAGDGVLRERWENIDLDYYIGFDPAIAVSDRADRTAVVVLGVTKDISQAYIVDVIAKRISFPDQIDLIRELHLRWRPHYIGIESVAYQAALAQQAMRIEGLPPIIPVFPTGKKKEERIMAMTPLFKIGRVQIRASFKDFIDEWLMYDPEVKRPKDDTLDAAEIALGTAGVLLPGMPQVEEEMAAANMDELAARLRKDLEKSADQRGCDEHLGFEW